MHYRYPSLTTRLRFKKSAILDLLIYFLFACTFVSLPAASFRGGSHIITWFFTICLCVAICFKFVYHKFIIDIINTSLLFFAISAIVSTLLNNINHLTTGPTLIPLVTVFIYTYCKTNKKAINILIYIIYFDLFIFSLIYVFKYHNEILSQHIDRLGDYFGDVNDISLFFCLGFTIGFGTLLFNKKNIFLKYSSLILIPYFGFLSLTTGSKIVILILACICLIALGLFFGKKRWWATIIVLAVIIFLFVIVLSLPYFKTFAKRITSFFSIISGGPMTDQSTASRFKMLLIGLDMFLRKPLWGFGINGSSFYNGFNLGWSHNNISELLGNYGIFGTVCFSISFVIALLDIIKKHSYRNEPILVLILFFYIIVMISIPLDKHKLFFYSIGPVFACFNHLPYEKHIILMPKKDHKIR